MVKSLWNHAWNMICIHCLGTGGSFPAFWLFLALKPPRISLTLCAIFTGGPYPVSGQTHRKDMEKPWTTPQVMVRSKFKIVHSWHLFITLGRACPHQRLWTCPASPAFGRCPESAVWKVEVPGATPRGGADKNISGWQDDDKITENLSWHKGAKISKI